MLRNLTLTYNELDNYFKTEDAMHGVYIWAINFLSLSCGDKVVISTPTVRRIPKRTQQQWHMIMRIIRHFEFNNNFWIKSFNIS